MLKISNVRTDAARGEAVVTLNPHFYPLDVVEATAARLSSACGIRVSENGAAIEVALKPTGNAPMDTLGYEFMNHLLASIKNGTGD